MTWNYRVLRQVYDGEDFYAIHEVYYDDDGNPQYCTLNSVGAAGDTMDELKQDLLHYVEAVYKPVLDYNDFLEREQID